MKPYDIIIIGGGPAGASAALFLEKKGYHIALLDQARFPRDKVCGEFISPAADVILSKLGVLDAVEALNPTRLRGIGLSAYESSWLQVDYPSSADGAAMTSLSVERSILDNLMLDKVRNSRIELMEGFKVVDLLFEDNRVCGVKGNDETKTEFSINAKIVIDAGGRNSISVRRLNLRKNSFGTGKIALATHWEDVKLPRNYCYMHISHPGYTGMAPVGDNRVNVVLIVEKGCLKGENVDNFFRRTVLKNKLRKEMLGTARPTEKARVIDSLTYSVKAPQCGGLLLVGDATGFIDPFTGEGIYLSLRSSQLASGTVKSAFDRSDFSKERLKIYDRIRRKEFKNKVILSKILQRLIYSPSLCVRVVKTLANQKELSNVLVGVIGDYIPANRVVCFEYFLRVLGGLLRSQTPFLQASQSLPNKSALDEKKLAGETCFEKITLPD